MLLHAFIPASRANGPGLRAVIYFQGCSLNCPGCWNPTSHKFRSTDLTTTMTIDSVVRGFEAAARSSPLEGVTFSGGEPMQQVQALVELMEGIRRMAPSTSMGMFTGYTAPELDEGQYATRPITPLAERHRLWRIVRDHLDFAVMGRYDRTQPGMEPLRTSKNQELVLFSGRYEERDFGQQFVEVGIDQRGTAVVTGFPILGFPTS